MLASISIQRSVILRFTRISRCFTNKIQHHQQGNITIWGNMTISTLIFLKNPCITPNQYCCIYLTKFFSLQDRWQLACECDDKTVAHSRWAVIASTARSRGGESVDNNNSWPLVSTESVVRGVSFTLARECVLYASRCIRIVDWLLRLCIE